MKKPTNNQINKALDKLEANKRVYKTLYKNESPFLRAVGAEVTRGNVRKAKQTLKRL